MRRGNKGALKVKEHDDEESLWGKGGEMMDGMWDEVRQKGRKRWR